MIAIPFRLWRASCSGHRRAKAFQLISPARRLFGACSIGRKNHGRPMKKETSKRLTREQRAELKSLAVLPNSAIDMSDAPEPLDWSGAKRGLFYRPVRQQLMLCLNADVVA